MAAERKDDAVQRDAAGADNGASWPLYGLFAICALLVAVDPFIHKHGKFETRTHDRLLRRNGLHSLHRIRLDRRIRHARPQVPGRLL